MSPRHHARRVPRSGLSLRCSNNPFSPTTGPISHSSSSANDILAIAVHGTLGVDGAEDLDRHIVAAALGIAMSLVDGFGAGVLPKGIPCFGGAGGLAFGGNLFGGDGLTL